MRTSLPFMCLFPNRFRTAAILGHSDLKMWPLKMYLDNKCNLSNGRSACEDALLLQVSSKIHQSKISPEMSYMMDENNERQLSWPFVFCTIQIYCMTMEKDLDTRPSRKYVNATCMTEWEKCGDLKQRNKKTLVNTKVLCQHSGFSGQNV